MAEKILVIDDEPSITKAIAGLLTDEGYRTETAPDAESALNFVRKSRFDLILLDLNLPGMQGVDFLRTIQDQLTVSPVLVISGQSDIPTALEAVKLGALDYLEKPVQPEKLLASVRSSLQLSAAQRQRAVMLEEIDNSSPIIGDSAPVKELIRAIDQVAAFDSPVLLTGENGTGKELAATRLYLASKRRDNPFVKVNCPGIPETLFESELFGHLKGAFTGAVKDYAGKFALADGGTIFLDEIGDLPQSCQAKLLRVLENGEIQRLGDPDWRTVNVRVICATNRNLKELVAAQKFREDLFYRISVLTIQLPPLRDRRDDIPLLIGEFLRRFDPGETVQLSPDAMARMATLDYPGNIRQLKNIIERLTIICQGRTIEPKDILADPALDGSLHQKSAVSLHDRIREYERHLIRSTLDKTGGNIAEAARLLKTARANLSKRIKEYGLK